MEQVEDVSTWKVKELREWLDRATITYSKTAKKQELIDLVVDAGKKGVVIERITTETEISKLTVEGLIQWLTERNVDLPTSRQKKQFYVDMAEAYSQSLNGDESPRSPPRAEKPKRTPATTPRPSRAASRKTPTSKAKSVSPTRRRSARRKLLDMPDTSSSSNEEDEETAETGPAPTQELVVVPAASLEAPSPNRNRFGSMLMLFVIFTVISAYIAYLTKSLIPHLNW